MTRPTIVKRAAILLLLLSTLDYQLSTQAQGTAFTYQGQLKDGPGPANGSYDLTLSLFGVSSGGSAVGGPVIHLATPVTNGLFTVSLDFGTGKFTGLPRWLEMGVRTNGSGSFATLNPRQPLTPAPYAIYAASAGVGGGSPWLLNGSNTFYNGGRVGIGTATPATPLHIASDAESVMVLQDTGPASTQSGYLGFWNATPTETAWVGFGTPGSPHFSMVNARSLGDIVLTPGQGGHIFLSEEVKVGGAPPVGTSELFLLDNVGENWGTILRVQGNAGGTVFRVDNDGDVIVAGNLTKGGGSFKIDHPLEPADKYLSHSFVESPDMMNIYNGNVITDAKGNAAVTLPDWFGALNRDFRYQLTVIGQFAQAIVSKEVSGNQFSIQTDKPNVKVSWQITGIRQDAYANAHRIPVEELKTKERGFYLHPALFGQPGEKGVEWAHRQEMTNEIKEQQRLNAPEKVAAGGTKKTDRRQPLLPPLQTVIAN
ncbi:MAG: hypothetical protein H7Y43_11910 [Akkermansiaceae bacterium]|nr:hypothetical protein [Verrucomicrobiales bacterium]